MTQKKEKQLHNLVILQLTGIPMESRARSQSNLVIRNLNGFSSEFHKFSNTIVPMFWAEYVIILQKVAYLRKYPLFSCLQNQVGLPFYISALMYFTVEIVRPFQNYFSAILILSGIIMLLLGTRQLLRRRSHLATNKALHFEQELFFAEHCK